MKAQELRLYTQWLADNYRIYRSDVNLWETKTGTEIVSGDLLPRYYLKYKNRKAKGVFGFLARLLPFLFLPILPVKPILRDTAKTDTVRVKMLPPVAVKVYKQMPKQ